MILSSSSSRVSCILHMNLKQKLIMSKFWAWRLFHLVCFAYRVAGAYTESIQTVHQRIYQDGAQEHMEGLQPIFRKVLFYAVSRPHVLPLAPDHPERTTVGKLSPSKVMAMLLKGDYETESSTLKCCKQIRRSTPVNRAMPRTRRGWVRANLPHLEWVLIHLSVTRAWPQSIFSGSKER
jgi:hypothetical protein